ncbi:putative Late nodulin [Medicago truncatula]|uniref:Putative Late nodulin n=1 Tax=Medicago truncatula TaxID=3880 RepID=A0A396J936_MEDTR|nr:putative Late nodulin [Medicago truncatula]
MSKIFKFVYMIFFLSAIVAEIYAFGEFCHSDSDCPKLCHPPKNVTNCFWNHCYCVR